MRIVLRNCLITLLFPVVMTLIAVPVDNTVISPVGSLYTFGVFMVSWLTRGYVYGITASLISTFLRELVFEPPRWEVGLTLAHLMPTAVMVVISIATVMMTLRIRQFSEVQKQAEAEAVRNNLLRSISHDLRTPLQVITGNASTLAESGEALPSAIRADLSRQIVDESTFMLRMVENLLQYSRFQGTEWKLNCQTEAAEELLIEAVGRMRGRAVQLTLPDELILLHCDATLVLQVLLNLLENALHFAKGDVAAGLSPENDRAVFWVFTPGAHIPEDELPFLFSSFFVGRTRPELERTGIGLGLSFSEMVASHHGGGITCNNTSDGVLFRAFFPVQERSEVYDDGE